MLIINADDWGRSREETDAALVCVRNQRVTSVSAMVFMADSERAAGLAREHDVDAGLHLNLNEAYSGEVSSPNAKTAHARVCRFMKRSKFAVLIYNPLLRASFRDVFQSQWDEFVRLFGKTPSHVDGHQHRHLAANILFDDIIPVGLAVRRNFTFAPGEKSGLNRAYRGWVDRWLARRYRLTDHLFNLAQCMQEAKINRLLDLARITSVEMETHPCKDAERAFLSSDSFWRLLQTVKTAPYAAL
jgi:predicted glycoside hydrolase/deacetylase ChbG (UPF0249 family)